MTTLLITGCAWVKLTPPGEKVRVLEAHEVSTCEELGKTTASLADKIAGIKRNPGQVKKELEILARNSAANMGGDTIVPITGVSDGQQSFAVYKCVGAAR
ncbi:MAG TPA: DUF4156 domain-containing protein [Sedimenticola sp.]|nr:DUF4156 domain-containing protein [Sedimenticola sp.]